MGMFEAVRLTDRVYWVGAVDWGIRDFHGYSTHSGSTYNAYLILAEKVTLIDTVKKPFFDEMMARISSVIDPSTVDIIVSNHSEMDHSGCLPQAIDRMNPERVCASFMGCKALAAHFHWEEDRVEAVKTGDSISLGDMNLNFIETRMLHWPDSMVSYLPEEKILFSQDGFGMHLASNERFDDQLPLNILEKEASKYYANILLPYSKLVTALSCNLKKLNLDIRLLCPDHGPVWRSNIDWILGKWEEWSLQKPSNKAVVVYDTMWGSTEKMAQAVNCGLVQSGAEAVMMPLKASHISDVAENMLHASALLVGSPTINGRTFPSVVQCMSYLAGLKPAGKIGAAFGSYGWSGEAVSQLETMLEEMKAEIVVRGLRARYVPDGDSLDMAVEMGKSVGERLAELCGGDK